MTAKTTSPPLLNATLRWFLFGMILANIAGQMIHPMMALYLTELGANVGQVGLVLSVASVVPFILQIFGGWLSDTIGRLRTIAIGASVATLGYFGIAAAPTWGWVMLALSLEYVSVSMVAPSFGAFIADESSEETRGRVFGMSEAVFSVVGVIGPPLAGWLVDWRGFRFMMFTSFIIYVCATTVRVWMALSERFKSQRAVERPTISGLRQRLGMIITILASGGVLTWVLLTDGISDVAYRLSFQFQSLYLTEIGGLSVTQVGILTAVLSLAMMLVTAPAGWLSDRFSERATISAGFLLIASSVLVFINAGAIFSFSVAMALMGAGLGTLIPSYESLISKATPEHLRGIAYGFFQTSVGVISLPAPWIGGQLWQIFSPRAPFLVTGIACTFAALIAWFKFKLDANPDLSPNAD
jgi:MFS family permease